MANSSRYLFHISPSKWHRYYLWLSILLPLLLIGLLAVPMWVKSLLCAMLAISGGYSFFQSQKNRTQFLEYLDANRWLIHQVEYRLLPNSYISGYLLVLRFIETSGTRRLLVLFRDTLSRDDFRRLRLLARKIVRDG